MNLVVLTGAGVSAESGLKTFRDSGGLWEGYDVMEVASISGWQRDPGKVLEFYNMRRAQARNAKPNRAHALISALQDHFPVQVITQNIDNLHEQAGSKEVLHLHGELFKVRSTADESLIYDWKENELNLGDTCELGSQLRPHIVWFGEPVYAMEQAAHLASKADLFLIVGTSLVVYPAAGLVDFVPAHAPVYIVDPHLPEVYLPNNPLHAFEESACTGMEKVFAALTENL